MYLIKKIYREEEFNFNTSNEDAIFIQKKDGKITSLTSKIYKKCIQNGVQLYYILDEDKIENSEIKRAGINVMSSRHPANLQELKDLVDKGVNGVWLADSNELVFKIKDIANFLHNQNTPVSLMVTINSGENDFFVRPEDLTYYEIFLDFGFLLTPMDRKRLIIDAYTQRHWEGLLTDIIVDKAEERIITNKGFLKGFGINRINCGKRCLLDQCRLCENAYETNSLISNLGLEIKETSLDSK